MGRRHRRRLLRHFDGRFYGYRLNVESVPRRPTFPVRWLLADPRQRPYFVFWTTRDGHLAYPLRIEAVDHGTAVQLMDHMGRTIRVALVRRTLPTGGGTTLLYVCPACGKARRSLYTHTIVSDRVVENFRWRCQACAGLRWASQGRYHCSWEEKLFAAIGAEYGAPPGYREPLTRRPWEPRAVSDPQIVADEFNVTATEAARAGGGRYGVILWVKPRDVKRAAQALGAVLRRISLWCPT